MGMDFWMLENWWVWPENGVQWIHRRSASMRSSEICPSKEAFSCLHLIDMSLWTTAHCFKHKYILHTFYVQAQSKHTLAMWGIIVYTAAFLIARSEAIFASVGMRQHAFGTGIASGPWSMFRHRSHYRTSAVEISPSHFYLPQELALTCLPGGRSQPYTYSPFHKLIKQESPCGSLL